MTSTNFERLFFAVGQLHTDHSRNLSMANLNGLAFCYSGSNVFGFVNVIEHLPYTIKVQVFSPGFIISQVYSVKVGMKYMGTNVCLQLLENCHFTVASHSCVCHLQHLEAEGLLSETSSWWVLNS